jgi:RNA polymerase sigma-70 factor (ECF subfamily)
MSDPRTGVRKGEGALLPRARAGGETAFGELVEPFRRELQVHCYRIVGSVQDAEDLAQETLLAAWRGLDSFEGRASMRSWLYRIATNRCLNALRERGRRLVRGRDRGDVASVRAMVGGRSRAARRRRAAVARRNRT